MLTPALQSLFDTLDRRERPEEVARLVQQSVTLTPLERRVISKASSRSNSWSSMSSDFARPIGMANQIAVACTLFDATGEIDPNDMGSMEQYLRVVSKEIGKEFGANDFLKDRLPRAARAEKGIELSKRQYNKRFRLAARMERKRKRVIRETLKRTLALASKSRLANQLGESSFTDANTAAFLAYYVSRCNLRSAFTNQSQVRPYDEICEMLMNRCRNSKTTNWAAIAHALPDSDVLERVSASDKGELLGRYFDTLKSAADLLGDLWKHNNINRESMIVRKGNDSSTWNATAGAWNKIRSGWFSLLFSLGLHDWIESVCPGKVLRLMAADVAVWHWMSGGDLHADTGPWRDLPLPWQVLNGETCTKGQVLAVCKKWNVDPIKRGWIAPPPKRQIVTYTPTPELVHGVEVSSPHLAKLLRSVGVFSGKVKSVNKDVLG